MQANWEIYNNIKLRQWLAKCIIKQTKISSLAVIKFCPRLSLSKTIKIYVCYCDEIITIMMMKGRFFNLTSQVLCVLDSIFLISKFTQVFPLHFFSQLSIRVDAFSTLMLRRLLVFKFFIESILRACHLDLILIHITFINL